MYVLGGEIYWKMAVVLYCDQREYFCETLREPHGLWIQKKGVHFPHNKSSKSGLIYSLHEMVRNNNFFIKIIFLGVMFSSYNWSSQNTNWGALWAVMGGYSSYVNVKPNKRKYLYFIKHLSKYKTNHTGLYFMIFCTLKKVFPIVFILS